MSLSVEASLGDEGDRDYDLIVIGGGPAGATAALYAARADLKTLVVDKGLTAGALGLTGKIANYPGILGEVGGAELVARMRQQGGRPVTDFLQGQLPTSDTGCLIVDREFQTSIPGV